MKRDYFEGFILGNRISIEIFGLNPNYTKIMKTMTCRQLGGACDLAFHADTFEEMAEQSKAHGTEMFQNGDTPHINAMKQMQEMMKTPKAMQQWFADKKAEFEAL